MSYKDPRGENVVAFRPKSQTTILNRTVTCSETLQHYWNSLAANGSIPYRQDIRADALKGSLKNLILFDKISPSEVRIRLHGHSISNLFRQDLTGVPLSAIMSSDGRLALADIVLDIYTNGRPRILNLEEQGFAFGKKLCATMGLFPLLDHRGKATKGIGFIDLHGAVKAKEYRFNISNISEMNQSITRLS